MFFQVFCCPRRSFLGLVFLGRFTDMPNTCTFADLQAPTGFTQSWGPELFLSHGSGHRIGTVDRFILCSVPVAEQRKSGLLAPIYSPDFNCIMLNNIASHWAQKEASLDRSSFFLSIPSFVQKNVRWYKLANMVNLNLSNLSKFTSQIGSRASQSCSLLNLLTSKVWVDFASLPPPVGKTPQMGVDQKHPIWGIQFLKKHGFNLE